MSRRRADPTSADPTSADPDSQSISTNFDGEDFLFHLYRGSELLQDNRVSEAKDELESALAMQPSDLEGKGLLGVVYFRLGMYPQAIRIYEEIVRVRALEVTPRINLALCYLKTGQSLAARNALEEVIQLEPEHPRAWGYLGLVFERSGDYAKARVSFDRAGQPHLARRMERLARPSEPVPPSVPPGQAEMQRAAQDAAADMDQTAVPGPFALAEDDDSRAPSRSGQWRAVELGGEPLPAPTHASGEVTPASGASAVGGGSLAESSDATTSDPLASEPLLPASSPSPLPRAAPQAPSALAKPAGALNLVEQAALPFPATAGLGQTSDGLVLGRCTERLIARADAIRALIPGDQPFEYTTLCRRARGRELEEPLGGLASPVVALSGAGCVVLGPRPDHQLVLLSLAGDVLYVREERLTAMEAGVQFENGRFAVGAGQVVPMVQLSAVGAVSFESLGPLRSLPVTVGQAVVARSAHVIGWIGRLLPRPVEPDRAPGGVSGLVVFSGDGALLLDAHL